MNYFAIAFGAVLGALSRYGIFIFLGEKLVALPLRTLVVNILGCFVVGLVAEYFALRHNVPIYVKLFFITGFLGSFTTFSTFAMDAGIMIQKNAIIATVMYAAISVIGGVLVYFGGIGLMRFLLR
ncbi:MAG: fluoride efflux transporter CrcB [Campylobacteraceae bacterium]|nr:fluoride efflux transporter CrcB [Campylobacteraceae bacterium]